MMPPRPEYQPITPLEAMAAQAAVHTKEGASSLEGKTDHSAHISCEGHDPCHEDQLSVVRMEAQTPAQQQPGLALEWSGDALIKSIVMQEVLTRPAQRRAR